MNNQNIFYFKPTDAHRLKILAEILNNNIKTGCFVITKDNIRLRMMDNHHIKMIDLQLDADKAVIYKYNAIQDEIRGGLTISHAYKMLKSIKKKDIVSFVVRRDDPTKLVIRVASSEEGKRTTTSNVVIQECQNIELPVPDGYCKPVLVKSSEFQKMCKDTLVLNKTVLVESRDSYIKFTCDIEGIMGRCVEFGELDDDEENPENQNEVQTHEFETDHLIRATKITSLATNMQIYISPSNMMYKSNIGEMGTISIYIKNKAQIEKDSPKE
jgi:proliferating cell nuclear antigen